MYKGNLQLLSVRLDQDILDHIDDFLKRRSFWKRNTVINAILLSVFNDFDERAVYDMVRRNHLKDEPVHAEYRIERVIIPPKSEDKSW